MRSSVPGSEKIYLSPFLRLVGLCYREHVGIIPNGCFSPLSARNMRGFFLDLHLENRVITTKVLDPHQDWVHMSFSLSLSLSS